MDFTLSDEQRQLQQLARDFTRKEIMPIAAEYDQKEELPWQVVEKAFEVGLLNVGTEEHKGRAELKEAQELVAAAAPRLDLRLTVNGEERSLRLDPRVTLLDALREQGVRRMWLEVIRDNHAAVALYQSLGFEVRHGLCGYLSAQAGSDGPSVLEDVDVLALTRRAGAEINGQLPWLMDPLTFSTLPCRALSLHQQAFAVLATLSSRPQLQFLWVDPAARGRGLGREMLMALAKRFPGLGTSVTIPERFTPLFHAAGYTPMALKQYEMSATLSAPPPAGR